MTQPEERRAAPRRRCDGRIYLMWSDGESGSYHAATLRNVGEGGLGLETYHRLPAGTAIYFLAPHLSLDGRAMVRHDRRRGFKRVVGLSVFAV